jgi:hypothetical protein
MLRDALVLLSPYFVFIVPMVLYAFWQEEIAPRLRDHRS